MGIKELEIRNNLKLGLPTFNEFHIENEVSIFFQEQNNNIYVYACICLLNNIH